MFVDRAIIQLTAGKGGDGCLSFYRGKGIPKGGPDGGDGGKGGDIVFATDSGVNTLYDFRGRQHWRAKNGEQGRGKSQFGAAADDLVIRVPEGTLNFDNDSYSLTIGGNTVIPDTLHGLTLTLFDANATEAWLPEFNQDYQQLLDNTGFTSEDFIARFKW